jgi:hypothetical protein
VLTYWRAGAYHLDPTGWDGYAGGPGNTNGTKHGADYSASYWAMNGTEANRVLSYWRAGSYHVDASGADGYAPGISGGTMSAMGFYPSAAPVMFIDQDAPATYRPGQPLTVKTRLAYGEAPLSLLWRPQLPSGWTLVSVSGDGNPEMSGGEILWAGALPPSPIRMVYTVQVPAGATGVQPIHGEVEYQFAGMVNPATGFADPDPLAVDASADLTNHPPVLTVPASQTLDELSTLTVTNTATDPDLPTNTLTFSLVSAPTGVSVNPTNGVLTWMPTEVQAPSTNLITVRVTDNGAPLLSDTKSFTVEVNVTGTPLVISGVQMQGTAPRFYRAILLP